MRCLFCNIDVMKKQGELGAPITLPGKGVAHSACAEKDLIERRIFGSIALKDIENNDLYELRELLLMEINEREGHSSGEVELF